MGTQDILNRIDLVTWLCFCFHPHVELVLESFLNSHCSTVVNAFKLQREGKGERDIATPVK